MIGGVLPSDSLNASRIYVCTHRNEAVISYFFMGLVK